MSSRQTIYEVSSKVQYSDHTDDGEVFWWGIEKIKKQGLWATEQSVVRSPYRKTGTVGRALAGRVDALGLLAGS